MTERLQHVPLDLGAIITRLQSRYIRGTGAREVFDALLPELLALTDSEYGFIGEVRHDEGGRPYLKTFTLTNIAWDEATRQLVEARRAEGLDFRNLDSLFGVVLSTGEPVIANDPASDPRRCGLPKGHPALDAFLGVPLFQGGTLVGQVGLANRPGGYDQALLDGLQPLFATVGSIMGQVQLERERQSAVEALRVSEALYRTTFEHAGIGLAHVGLDGRYLAVNAHQCAILGRSADELRGLRWQDLTHPDDIAADLALMQQLADGRLARYELEKRFLRPDGSVVWTCLTVALLRDDAGRPQLVLSTLQDIGERRQLEQIRVAAEAAQRANRAKTEFLSRMSHELRTPLNAVLGFAQLLRMDGQESLTARQQTRVQHIEQAGRHLLAMINDVLDLSRIEEGVLSLRSAPVRVAEVVGEAVALLQPAADEAGVRMQLPVSDGDGHLDDAHVWADAHRLRQVLVNLLSNAVKYNHRGGEVRLGWRDLPDGRVRIDVADTGPGLSEDQRRHLFEPFNRLGAEATRIEGSGIGLVISRGLVHRMGGELALESAPGQGSCFSILLPAEGPSGPEPESGPGPAPAPAPVPRAP